MNCECENSQLRTSTIFEYKYNYFLLFCHLKVNFQKFDAVKLPEKQALIY